jgi:hypothetical protein
LTLLALLIAARITTIAGARDEGRPFEIEVEAAYAHLRADTTISRERASPSGFQFGDELLHVRTLDAVELRLAAGIWHDLELHVFAPYALRDAQEWGPVAGGTLASNPISISGCGAPGSCTAVQPIGTVAGRSQRKGFFDPTVGIAWSPVNEERQSRVQPGSFPGAPSAATWVLGLDYTVPLGGKVDDPTAVLGGTSHPEEKQAHVLTAWTAFSKRFRTAEPYLKLEASAPFASSKAYDNCRHPERLSDVAATNCAVSWKGETGYRPAYEAALTLGSEIVASEDRSRDQRFSFDVRAGVRWHGPSRGYTQVTDMLGKLTYADEYLTGTGQLAFYGRIARWFQVRVAGLVGVDSAHFLTHEDIGQDKNGDGVITISQGTGAAAPDQNPNYDFRVDQVGRRLRAEPAIFWGVSGTLTLSF